VLCCLAVQLQGPGIGVTTKDPDSGPVPRWWRDIDSSDQYWYVYIRSDGCTAWHKGQRRELQWVLDCSAGNTFGCQVSGTGELHLHHNWRDVGVAREGLPTDQPLWGFVVLAGYKVEANYVIAQSEAVCVSVCMSTWPLRWKVFIYMTCIQHCAVQSTHSSLADRPQAPSVRVCVSQFTSYQCQLLQPSSVGYMHVVHLLQATPRTMLARPSTLWRGPLSGWSVQCVRH